MIGLDTNVLVRYITQDEPSQSVRASKFIEQECSQIKPGFVGIVTLVELVWVIETCYGALKSDVISLLQRLLSTKQLVIQDAETVWKALRLYESGQADFADYLIERIANTAGCGITVTFDKVAAKAGMTLLK
jgi:predicted nucleic-acid-binding protein